MTTAMIELRRHGRSALLVCVMAMVAVAMVAAVRTLAREGADGPPALSLPHIAQAGPVFMGRHDSRPPAATQAKAVADLLSVLQVVAWTGFLIAGLSILTCTAAQHGSRAVEYAIQRAVGAPTSVLRRAIALEQSVPASLAVTVGLLSAIALLLLGRSHWPGQLGSVMSALAVLVPVLAVILVFAGAAGVIGRTLRDQFMVAPPSEEVRVLVPTCQVAATVAVLMATAAVLWPRERQATAAPDTRARGMVSRIDSGIADRRTRATKYAALVERLGRDSAITTVSLASAGAIMGIGTKNLVTVDCGRCYVGGVSMRWQSFDVVTHAVSPGTFEALASRTLDGRALDDTDGVGARSVAIVSRSVARAYFDDGRGIGRRLYLPSRLGGPYIVVGVVDDTTPTGVGGPSQPLGAVYLSATQEAPPSVELLTRGADTAAVADAVRRGVQEVLGPRAEIRTLTSESAHHSIQRRAVAWFGTAAGVAGLAVLLLALLGTTASAAAWARSVTWELSLRRAVGARWRHIVMIVLARAARIAVVGAIGGLFVYAVVLAPELGRLLPGVALPPPGKAVTVIAVPVLLSLVAGMAAGLQVLVRQPPASILH